MSLPWTDLVLRAPEWLALLLLLPLLVPFALRSLSGLTRWRRLLSLAARSLLLTCLVIALARPSHEASSTLTSTVFLADVSDSMTDDDLARMGRYLGEAQRLRGEHHVELVSFADAAQRIEAPAEGAVVLQRHAAGAATDIQGALSLALGLLKPERLPQVVLWSDGQETRGSLARGAAQLAELGVPLYVVEHAPSLPPEVAIEALELPEAPKVGEPFSVRVRVAATAPQKARVRLLQNGLLNGLEGAREVELAAGGTELAFRAVAHVSGPLNFRAEVEPRGEDRFPQNNAFARSVLAVGSPRVLYVEGASGEGAPFQGLLDAAGFEVDLRSARGFPSDARDLRPFDFVILSDVARDQLSQGSLQAIASYLSDGGGFMMAGGAQSFGLGGYRGSSLESLLPVRLDTERRRDQPSLALVLVIDKSGSMSGEKIELAKEAARATSELLGAEDFLGVIGFDAAPDRVVRLASAANRVSISRGIGRLAAGGGTQIFPALDAAYADLLSVRARVKHVILLTDGQTQERGLALLIQNMQVDGITVSTIGLGDDVNRALIEELARLGRGRAYFTVDPSSVPRIFVKETHAVARSSAVEDYVGVQVAAPADFLRGIPMEAAPLLRGYVATRARPAPAQVILRSEFGEPVLARMRVGLGWSLAWTSDVKPRWSAPWFSWKPHSAFWAQLIREHMRTRREDTLNVEARLEGDRLRARVEVLDDNGRFVNGLKGSMRVAPLGGAQDAASAHPEIALSQLSPGRYEASLRLDGPGSYAVRAQLNAPQGATSLVGETTLSHPFPSEYALTRSPEAAGLAQQALSDTAARTGGGRLPADDPGAVFRQGEDRRTIRWLERWSMFLWLALGLFVLDIAIRRWPRRRPREIARTAHEP